MVITSSLTWLLRVFFLICTIILLPSAAQGQSNAPAPPANVTAADHPWDNGTRIDLNFQLSPDDAALQGYVVRKKMVGEAAFTLVDIVPRGSSKVTVNDLTPGKPYLFEIAAVAKDNTESNPAATAASVAPCSRPAGTSPPSRSRSSSR